MDRGIKGFYFQHSFLPITYFLHVMCKCKLKSNIQLIIAKFNIFIIDSLLTYNIVFNIVFFLLKFYWQNAISKINLHSKTALKLFHLILKTYFIEWYRLILNEIY